MPIKPVRNLLYILPLDRLEKIGLIHLPQSHEPRTNQGIVKYRGPDTDPEKSGIRVGDHVYFSGYDGDEIVFEDEGRLILIQESAVDAVDGGPGGSFVLTIAQFKIIIDRAVARLIVKWEVEDAKNAAELVGDRIKEELDGILEQELHF